MPSRQSVPFFFILVLSLLLGLFIPVHTSSAAPELNCVFRVVDSLNPSGDGSTWAKAFTDLNLAITTASSGCEVWVAQGVYTPGTSPDASFSMKNNVAIYGGFNGTETERAQRDWKKNITTLSGGMIVHHVVNNLNITRFAVLDGFTITNGNATGTGADGRGGGMYNYESSPTLTNLTISVNTAATGGGMFNYNGSPMLTNVIFSGNIAGYGGGMYNTWMSPTLTNVTFSGNTAGNQGGGLMNDYSNPTLTNVTLSGNSAGEIGGGIYFYQSSAQIYNSIIWGNTGGGIDIYGGANVPTFTNSLAQGCTINTSWICGHDGGSNMGADPLFIDANGPDDIFGTADDNPRLMNNSPARDTGNNSFLPADMLDLDGDGITSAETIPYDLDMHPRIFGAQVDMGAYEVNITTIFLPHIKR
jgi:hypothetical protein